MVIEEMQAFAADFIGKIKPSQNGATVIGLRGDLGAGKTTFTQFCATLLGISENVTSPTFVILKKYKISKIAAENKDPFFSDFIHIDAYRLKGGKELNTLGWQDIISDSNNLIFVEWPELVADVMPPSTKYIDFKHIDEKNREVKLYSVIVNKI
jgi:tRNA threonylcarbamoyladenosine biosynthesis protein TsaE